MEATKISNFSIDHILGTDVGPSVPAGVESLRNVGCLPEDRLRDLSNGFNGNLNYYRPLTAVSMVPVPILPHDFNSCYLGYGSYSAPQYDRDFIHCPNLLRTSFNNERGSLQYPGQAAAHRLRARMRTVFTDSQTARLEQLFGLTDYPDVQTRAELARSIGLTEETVRVWFKNRRARRKRQKSGSKVRELEDAASSLLAQLRGTI